MTRRRSPTSSISWPKGYRPGLGLEEGSARILMSKTLPSRIFNAVVSSSTGIHMHDFNNGFKAYRREVTEELKLYADLHRFIPVMATWRGFRVAEIPVQHHPRVYGNPSSAPGVSCGACWTSSGCCSSPAICRSRCTVRLHRRRAGGAGRDLRHLSDGGAFPGREHRHSPPAGPQHLADRHRCATLQPGTARGDAAPLTYRRAEEYSVRQFLE